MGTHEATLVEIVAGVYAWHQPDGSWWVNNAGAVGPADPNGGHENEVLIVDTCATPPRTRRFLAAVDEATGGAPVRMAVNTHLHGDHTYGNFLLPEPTVVVAHEATREGVLADPIIAECPPAWEPLPDWTEARLRPPQVTLVDTLTLHVGGRRVELHHPGFTAHTPGDVVVWLPEERVLFTGDLVFHGVTPLVLMGSVEGATRCLEWLARFQPEHVVPGHGPLLGGGDLPDVLDAHARYYRLVADTAAWGHDRGLSPLQAARECDLGAFADWPDAERIVLNLHRAYADAEGRDVDVEAAFADAVTYNGGPLRCVA